jgi:hypothetical protein
MIDMKQKIFEALGTASMCWDPIPTGVFDSSAAQQVGTRLHLELNQA